MRASAYISPSCTFNFLFAINRFIINSGDGDLFMTGSNDYGQLGIGSRESQLLPARVSALDIYRITHVACGQAHTVAVTGTFVFLFAFSHVTSYILMSFC